MELENKNIILENQVNYLRLLHKKPCRTLDLLTAMFPI